jgi:hypothetical protein
LQKLKHLSIFVRKSPRGMPRDLSLHLDFGEHSVWAILKWTFCSGSVVKIRQLLNQMGGGLMSCYASDFHEDSIRAFVEWIFWRGGTNPSILELK